MTGHSAFRAALLDAGVPTPDGLLNPSGAPAGKRFDVYRNNVAVSLREALETGFPVLRKLLGPQNFASLAVLFLRAHPPSNPLMMTYGAEMPAFLEAFAPLRHLGYLPDMARLELALRRSYHAADADPVAPDALTTLSPEALSNARLTLAPSVELVPSPWPIYDIWAYNTQVGAPKPRALPQAVLVVRPDFDPEPHPLTAGEAACLAVLQAGDPLDAAFEAGAKACAAFDLSALLAKLLNGSAIHQISPK